MSYHSVCRAVALAITSCALVVSSTLTPALAHATASAHVDASLRPGMPAGGHFTPVTRAMFNNPLGDERAKRRLFRQITRAIDSTPATGVIRFAVFSFADKAVADALLRAHARGVDVKLLFAGNNVYPPMTRMRAALGRDPNAKSFAIFCQSSCRGEAGQMHAKFFSFSKVGNARHVTMVGSNNLTRHNSDEQWSDLYTVVGDQPYYRTFRKWFMSARFDRPVADPYVDRVVGTKRIMITPLALAEHPDPLVEALDSVVCLTPAGEIDPGAPDPAAEVSTRLLLAQSAWNGPRGVRLAQQVAGMLRSGCSVRVFYGEGVGPAVRNILSSAGADLRPGTHRGILTHEKLLIVRGNVGGRPSALRVWTGSQNWSTRALFRDDLIVRIDDQDVGQQYLDGFQFMWQKG